MPSASALAVAAIVTGAAWSVWDILQAEEKTLIVYTTPALRDLLENDLIPAFEKASGYAVAPVYVAAGQQYNRLRMSGATPEADIFLHASPLYLEKGYADGHVDPVFLEGDERLDAAFKSRLVDGGRSWYAFAWSPLVEVYPAGTARTPDLAQTAASFGFPHPILSNNGIWAVAFLERVDPATGQDLLRQTRVQPTNARANIGGVADGSFDLTLGYEAVVRFYQEQRAEVAYDVPLVHGERLTTRVVFSAALIHGSERHPGAEALLRFLFTEDAQDRMALHHFRPVLPEARQPEGALDLARAHMLEIDWSRWQDVEAALPRYEAKP